MSYIKRCQWAQPTPKIDDKYEAGPCEIMSWKENEQSVYCNGWNPACLGRDTKITDIRDDPISSAQKF